jgi:hypothetical protein
MSWFSNKSEDTITIDTCSSSTLASITVPSYSSINISNTANMYSTAGSYIYATPAWTQNTYSVSGSNGYTSQPGIKVTGDAEFEGDVKIKGASIAKTLEDIQHRLAILVPDPAKLEHFAALKKAYDHYKVMEALCELPTKTDE